MKKNILAIETSCDETGIALVEASGGLKNPRFKVLKNLVSSQIKIHRPFGGVVPALAKREHLKNLPILLKKRQESIVEDQNIDLIAVTVGPGLEPALWTGITFAKDLYKKLKIGNPKLKLIGANHLEGHLYSFLLPKKTANIKSEIRNPKQRVLEFSASNLEFPAVCLLVSGGHTVLLVLEDIKSWKKLGETRDDAAGEAFDKAARMLDLPYPGGPEIEKIARKGDPESIAFPQPMRNQKNYDFSFSGLKTAVFYFLREQKIEIIMNNEPRIKGKKIHYSQFTIQDVAASFQKAVTDVLVHKTIRAAEEYRAKSVILCGGVAANRMLREKLKAGSRKLKIKFFVPEMEYNGDNAAMIAAAGYFSFLKKKKLRMTANGDLGI